MDLHLHQHHPIMLPNIDKQGINGLKNLVGELSDISVLLASVNSEEPMLTGNGWICIVIVLIIIYQQLQYQNLLFIEENSEQDKNVKFVLK